LIPDDEFYGGAGSTLLDVGEGEVDGGSG